MAEKSPRRLRLEESLAEDPADPFLRYGLALQCLRRRGAPTRQVGAGRDQRLQTGRIDLELAAPAPATVLLVDDVHTTGATLDSCARILRAAGARRVASVTYARTLHPGG